MREQVRIAPLDSYQGFCQPKPWEYRVTVSLPHLDTLELLDLALDLWRFQTVRPYLMIVDTGSPADLLPQVEALRAPDCEIHQIRAHGYSHPSAPVCAALDLAQALCRTEYLLHTHVDVFACTRLLIEWLMGQCSPASPVVGWRMSPRNMSTAPSKEEWRASVSHTCTLLHMPTVLRLGLTWTMERYYAERPEERGHFAAWPDTESPFYLACRERGIEPRLLGDELNYARDVNEWWDHARSYTGLKAAARDGNLFAVVRLAKAQQYTAAALREARARLAQWKG